MVVTKYGSRQLAEDCADECAAMANRGNGDLDFAICLETVECELDPLNRDEPTVGRAGCRDDRMVAFEPKEPVGSATHGSEVAPDK